MRVPGPAKPADAAGAAAGGIELPESLCSSWPFKRLAMLSPVMRPDRASRAHRIALVMAPADVPLFVGRRFRRGWLSGGCRRRR